MNSKNKRAQILGVLSILVLLALIPMFCGNAAAADNAKFGNGLSDSAVEEHGVNTKLRITVPLNILVEGEYRVYANLLPTGVQAEVYSPLTLYSVGSYDVAIDVSGADIFESKQNGPYKIELTLLDSENEPQDTATYTTKEYFYKDFDVSSVSEDVPDIVDELGVITLDFEGWTVELDKTAPIVTYRYSDDTDGELTQTTLKMTRILAFNDANSDGIPQESEVKYRANLLNLYWDIAARLDSVYEIKLNAEVMLKDKSFGPGPRMAVTIVYPTDLSGASRQPVKVEMEPYAETPIDTTHICIETSLEDGSEDEREFLFESNKGSFLNRDDQPQNYLAWDNTCSITKGTQTTQQAVTFAYQEGNYEHLLYAATKISTDTTSITTSCSFGVEEGNYLEEEPPYEHNVWIYFLGIILAIGVVIGSFILQRKMSKREVME